LADTSRGSENDGVGHGEQARYEGSGLSWEVFRLNAFRANRREAVDGHFSLYHLIDVTHSIWTFRGQICPVRLSAFGLERFAANHDQNRVVLEIMVH
jgi:hypothetical protein